MPVMDLTYPAGTLTAQASERLASQLTEIVLRAEKAPDTGAARSMTLTYLHEVAPGKVLIGGKPPVRPVFRLRVTVLRGVLSDRRKQLLIRQVSEAIAACLPPVAGGAPHVLVLIQEFADYDLGWAGRALSLGELADMAQGAGAGGHPDASSAPGLRGDW